MINKTLYSSVKDDWETPDWLFSQLDAYYHFDIDLAANEVNYKVIPWVSAFFDNDEAVKNRIWSTGWLNPPYGRGMRDWMHRCNDLVAGTDRIILVLAPARTDTIWFHEECARHSIRFLKGRLVFKGAIMSAPFPSCLIEFKSENYGRSIGREVSLSTIPLKAPNGKVM